MKQYLDLIKDIKKHGEWTGDRTGTGTLSMFGNQKRFDLREGFPLVTTKKMFTRGIIHELLWFIAGDTNVKYLQENGVKIWDAWADEHGDLGPVYGKQWRSWPTPNGESIDQLKNIIDRIKSNPTCRRLIVTAWNPGNIDDVALAWCHCLFQFKVYGDYIDLQLYQRSADVFLGVPFNIASYALLLEMIAQVTGITARYFIHTFCDVHIYSNHVDQVDLQLTRDPLPLPTLKLNQQITDINDFTFDDIKILDYKCHDLIKGDVSV